MYTRIFRPPFGRPQYSPHRNPIPDIESIASCSPNVAPKALPTQCPHTTIQLGPHAALPSSITHVCFL